MAEIGALFGLLGTLLGICTATFIVYDRLYRGRPIISVTAERRTISENFLFVRIKNVLDHDIIVENWFVSDPRLISIYMDDTLRAALVGSLGTIPAIIIPPLGVGKLPLVVRGGESDFSQSVTIEADWDNTARPWPFRRYIKIKKTIGELRELERAHLPGE